MRAKKHERAALIESAAVIGEVNSRCRLSRGMEARLEIIGEETFPPTVRFGMSGSLEKSPRQSPIPVIGVELRAPPR